MGLDIEAGGGERSKGLNSSIEVTGESSYYGQGFWLLIWMANNILVTIMNKAIFANIDFKYPFALSTIHMACNVIGSQIYFFVSRSSKPKQLEGSSRFPIFLLSVVFALNIAIGNTSLRWVSVNFNQVCRALVPAIVMIISGLYFGKTYSSQRKWAVIPIVIGVALTFYGDMHYSAVGAFYTFLCVVLAALKAVMSGEILTGDLKLHPMDLLSKMCPLALMQITVMCMLSGELEEIVARWPELVASSAPLVVLLSGILAFSLNWSSFMANKVTSALTLCIAANVKQVLLVAVGTLYFGDPVGLINGCGIFLVMIASFKYSLVSLNEGKS
mmetsp:Transcript_10402/g.15819  ORF Transcript_10402/g.15819 Transcript_10402/m.15819 type:complete len:329 (-) Transcript_10402:131-1117(-)